MPFLFRAPVPITKADGPGRRWVRRASAAYRRKMRGPFLAAIDELKASVAEGDLEAAAFSENVDRIIEVSQVEQVGSIVGSFGEPLADAVAEGGRLAMKELPGALALDMQRPLVRRWLEQHTARLVTQVNGTSVKAVRAIIRDGFKAGRHPRNMARDIRAVVGLTEPQSIAVARYRQAMVESGVSEALVERRAAKYAERLLRHRAETIARTEAMTGVNAGRSQLWLQLQEDGGLEADARKEWLTADDERVCPICGPLDGTSVPLDGSYQLNTGASVEHPPAHPSCRCTEVLA